MRTSWIISIAAVCGVVAFIYTLASGSVRGRQVAATNNAPVFTTRATSPLPTTIEGLESLIEESTLAGRPLRGYAHFELARRYEDADRTEDARATWEQAARLRLSAAKERPNNPDHWFEAGWSLWKLGRLDEAVAPLTEAELLYSRIPQDQRTDQTWHRLGWARKLVGHDVDAVIAWSHARDLAAQSDSDWDDRNAYNLACYRALLGEKEAALSALEKAVSAGWTDAGRTTHDDDLVSLRDEARFIDAVNQMRGKPRIYRFGPG